MDVALLACILATVHVVPSSDYTSVKQGPSTTDEGHFGEVFFDVNCT